MNPTIALKDDDTPAALTDSMGCSTHSSGLASTHSYKEIRAQVLIRLTYVASKTVKKVSKKKKWSTELSLSIQKTLSTSSPICNCN